MFPITIISLFIDLKILINLILNKPSYPDTHSQPNDHTHSQPNDHSQQSTTDQLKTNINRKQIDLKMSEYHMDKQFSDIKEEDDENQIDMKVSQDISINPNYEQISTQQDCDKDNQQDIFTCSQRHRVHTHHDILEAKRHSHLVRDTDKIFKRQNSQGDKMINQYQILETLGEGSFAKVKRAKKHILNKVQYFAIKKVNKAKLRRKKEFKINSQGQRVVQSLLEFLDKEIAIMKKLDHENIIRLYEVIDDKENDKLYMVMQLAEKGEYITWDEDECTFYLNQNSFSQFDEPKLKLVFRKLISGLHFIHSANIVHRDIKPQNILFNNEDEPMLGDFGVGAFYQTQDNMNDNQGTEYFMSPESSKPGFSGTKSDIWALGVSFYCFAFLRLPFIADDICEFYETIRTQEVEFPEDNQYSQEMMDFISQFLIKDPQQRPSLEQLAKNRWLNQGHQSLFDEIQEQKEHAKLILEITQEEIDQAVIPIQILLMVKNCAKKMRASLTQLNDRRSMIHVNESQLQNAMKGAGFEDKHRESIDLQPRN